MVIDFDVQSLNPEQPGIKLKDRFLWNINGMSENGNLGLMSAHCLIRTVCHAETIRIDVLRRCRYSGTLRSYDSRVDPDPIGRSEKPGRDQRR